jgi:hypothetical protein
MRGVERRSVGGYKAAVCVHVDTQSGCLGGDEADCALQTRAECRVSKLAACSSLAFKAS